MLNVNSRLLLESRSTSTTQDAKLVQRSSKYSITSTHSSQMTHLYVKQSVSLQLKRIWTLSFSLVSTVMELRKQALISKAFKLTVIKFPQKQTCQNRHPNYLRTLTSCKTWPISLKMWLWGRRMLLQYLPSHLDQPLRCNWRLQETPWPKETWITAMKLLETQIQVLKVSKICQISGLKSTALINCQYFELKKCCLRQRRLWRHLIFHWWPKIESHYY